jgi:hypothetical protein
MEGKKDCAEFTENFLGIRSRYNSWKGAEKPISQPGARIAIVANG